MPPPLVDQPRPAPRPLTWNSPTPHDTAPWDIATAPPRDPTERPPWPPTAWPEAFGLAANRLDNVPSEIRNHRAASRRRLPFQVALNDGRPVFLGQQAQLMVEQWEASPALRAEQPRDAACPSPASPSPAFGQSRFPPATRYGRRPRAASNRPTPVSGPTLLFEPGRERSPEKRLPRRGSRVRHAGRHQGPLVHAVGQGRRNSPRRAWRRSAEQLAVRETPTCLLKVFDTCLKPIAMTLPSGYIY